MRSMHNLVKCFVRLIEGSISQPIQDVASPNLVCRYYFNQKITSFTSCCGNCGNQCKVVAVSYLIIDILSYFKA